LTQSVVAGADARDVVIQTQITDVDAEQTNMVAGSYNCHKLLMVVGQLLITPTVEICI